MPVLRASGVADDPRSGAARRPQAGRARHRHDYLTIALDEIIATASSSSGGSVVGHRDPVDEAATIFDSRGP
jgi:hypothetical protein